jgi:hypothetical protein
MSTKPKDSEFTFGEYITKRSKQFEQESAAMLIASEQLRDKLNEAKPILEKLLEIGKFLKENSAVAKDFSGTKAVAYIKSFEIEEYQRTNAIYNIEKYIDDLLTNLGKIVVQSYIIGEHDQSIVTKKFIESKMQNVTAIMPEGTWSTTIYDLKDLFDSRVVLALRFSLNLGVICNNSLGYLETVAIELLISNEFSFSVRFGDTEQHFDKPEQAITYIDKLATDFYKTQK